METPHGENLASCDDAATAEEWHHYFSVNEQELRDDAENALKNNSITQVESINKAAPAIEGDEVAVEDDEI